ncbi:MAG: ADP-ribose pyrophosphatase [Bacillales bacterium]|nr:ADP-ribose pyrophosphatase [Bacillales bacterium]
MILRKAKITEWKVRKLEQNKNTEVEENSSNYTSTKYVTPDGVPADIAIFTIISEKQQSQELPDMEVKVLMVKRKKWPYQGCWALPGGFSNPNELLLNTAKRELQEETSIEGLHIEHFGVYSTPGRDPRGWVISSAYMALVNEKYLAKRQAADDAADVQLISLNELLAMKKGNPDGMTEDNEDSLAFDHNYIIRDAFIEIQQKALTTDIAKEFLNETFTISELYQVIKTLVPSFNEEKPNFRRKILQRGVIEAVEATSNEHSKRHAKLFKFTGNVPALSIYS